MFRNILDAVLDDKAAPVIIVLAQVAILAWGWRRGVTPILWVNVILASAVILYNVTQIPTAIRFQDSVLLGFILFELGVLAVSVAAPSGLPIPAWLVWAAFAVNFVLSVALMVFALTFKMTRLF